ncbi:16S rRNA (uracil(1498)-N(3))-methyltransferase [Actinomadura macrotermitis]|uniref:Ribosomal RNA small subunit methyltransferase E n=1 Tax=Actinomadura macrotermitis TaxID=2585200 RepID=A0A7K0BNJ2_9ACTN|nr:16S rRNA (uracil(1498)-N(3))-methyltransferase [Actinomadura macrotermitis]MQY02741.1 Ribosomal RNA small subunit methyltransferase E [Actinomadura macrotermitis]
MSPPVFLADAGLLARDRVVLDGPEGRHAATVRRLRAGERVDLTDGAGLLAECVVAAADKVSLTLEVLARRHEPPPEPRLVVVQALPKGDRGELAVETMTEAGVDEIVPWAAARCVTQWRAERRDKALGRWRNAAREAAKQARRSRLPEVADLAGTAAVAERIAAAACALVLHEEAAEPLSALRPPAQGEIVVVVGPEGGISEEELAAFAAAGARTTRLGPTVLRTSTAGVAAAAVLMAATGRW